MTLTWGTYRTQIRRSILKEPIATNWTDVQLLDMLVWAQDTFCAHTALVTSITHTGPVSQSVALPDDIYSDLERTGLLYLRTTSTSEVINVLPASNYDFLESTTQLSSFSVWGDTLTLDITPLTSQDLIIRYFAFYPTPTSDSSLILLPRWALNAVANLVGALAQTPQAVNSAGINQWKDKKDSGTPEDNALRVQEEYMFKIYEREIGRYPRQLRENSAQKRL